MKGIARQEAGKKWKRSLLINIQKSKYSKIEYRISNLYMVKNIFVKEKNGKF